MDNRIILSNKDFHDILKTAYSLGYISGQQQYPTANLDAAWNADISEVFSIIMSTFPLEKVQ